MDVQDVQVQESIDDIADLISGMKIQAENNDEVDRDTTPTPQVDEDVEDKANILESPDKPVENILESENIHEIETSVKIEELEKNPESENSVKIDEIRVNKDSEDSEKIAENEKSGESENCQKSEESEKIHEIESSVKIEELENEEIQETEKSEKSEIIREIDETEKIVKTDVAIEEEKFVKIEEPEIIPEIESFENQNDTFEIPITTKPTDLKPSEPFENLVNISIEHPKIKEEKILLDTSEIENPPQAQPVEEFKSLEKLGKILTPVQKLKNAEKINGTPTDIEKIKLEKPSTPVKNEENGEQVIFNFIS